MEYLPSGLFIPALIKAQSEKIINFLKRSRKITTIYYMNLPGWLNVF